MRLRVRESAYSCASACGGAQETRRQTAARCRRSTHGTNGSQTQPMGTNGNQREQRQDGQRRGPLDERRKTRDERMKTGSRKPARLDGYDDPTRNAEEILVQLSRGRPMAVWLSTNNSYSTVYSTSFQLHSFAVQQSNPFTLFLWRHNSTCSSFAHYLID